MDEGKPPIQVSHLTVLPDVQSVHDFDLILDGDLIVLGIQSDGTTTVFSLLDCLVTDVNDFSVDVQDLCDG